jgi:hypothetical protein
MVHHRAGQILERFTKNLPRDIVVLLMDVINAFTQASENYGDRKHVAIRALMGGLVWAVLRMLASSRD